MNKELLFITSIILFTVALMLFIPTDVLATSNDNGNILVNNIYLYDGTGNETIGTVEGATYDLDTNTLTLDNFNGDEIFVNSMGDDFKIKLVNTNNVKRICSNDSVELVGQGNLNIDVEDGRIGIEAQDITINDAKITISVSEQNDALYSEAISANNIKINSGTITIIGTDGGILAFANLIINGGTISVTSQEIGLISQNVLINGGTITLKIGILGIHGESIDFKGGKTVIDTELCAIFAESENGKNTIKLADNMEIEEETSIRTGKYNIGTYEYQFTTFGTEEIVIDINNKEVLNASKKLEIKEKVKDSTTEEDEKNEELENYEESEEEQVVEENIQLSEKDDTPKTGNSSSFVKDDKIVLFAMILIISIIVFITKSKIE